MIDTRDPGLRRLLTIQQPRVVARRQLAELGASEDDVRRMLRRGELHRWHAGVYRLDTGPPTAEQRLWAAVLLFPRATLHRESALPGAAGLPAHVLVPHRTSTRRQVPGVSVTRSRQFDARVQPRTSPPRVSLEDAAVEAADLAVDLGHRLTLLADLLHTRRTTAQRVLAEVGAAPTLRHRAEIAALLTDIEAGTSSVLEREFLHRVQRAHGLPVGDRQRRAVSRVGLTYRDVELTRWGVVVELDGRAFHDDPRARARDLQRDLASLEQGLVTVRLGWSQVVRDPCTTAEALAGVLRARGWTGRTARCPRCP
ncbi:endonuclease domain-containing protein [Nocardioides bruguierae]|uniref:endonuclease domain-containing protein n=1 Tax=Nocardioides bruguierae TaxID=2945102 RepID=UPI0020201248|nr:endonuclease domain-containing protein [Nocardioides bruguierae]MCL8025148.1 endonuclease domain-containing protein [Nocardioides bruguierae]